MTTFKRYTNDRWIAYDEESDTPLIEVGGAQDDEALLTSIIEDYGYKKYDGYSDGADNTVWYHIYVSGIEEYKRFRKYFEKALKKLEEETVCEYDEYEEENSLRR